MANSEQTGYIKPDGNLVASTIEKVKKEIIQIIEMGHVQITIDLEAVEVVDSSGIGILVATFNELKEKKGSLSIINTGENIMKMFKIMRLDTHISISGK